MIRSRRGRATAAVAATASAGLLLAVLVPGGPAAAASGGPARAGVLAGSPGAPFVMPQMGPGIKSFNNVDELRTGGVNCPAPSELSASNAGDGSGQGYRVPFLMALTDGRGLAQYIPSTPATKLPFGTVVVGITGWVRGWVELPSLTIDVPDNGVTMCDGAKAGWSYFLLGQPYWFIAGPGVTPKNDPDMKVTPTAVRAAITGVAPSGELQFETSLDASVEMIDYNNSGLAFDCGADVTLDMGTGPQPLLTQFAPVPSVLPADPADWPIPGDYAKYYKPEYPITTPPPDKDWLPPSGLDSATTGGTATVANTTFVLPVLGGSQCPDPGFMVGIIEPKDSEGKLPDPLPQGPSICNDFPSPPYPLNYCHFPRPTSRGAMQLSVDITLADLGIPNGLPAGFGFS